MEDLNAQFDEYISLDYKTSQVDDRISGLPWERHHAIYCKVSKYFVTFDVYVPPLQGQKHDDAFTIDWSGRHRCYIRSTDKFADGMPAQSLPLTFPRLVDPNCAEVTWDAQNAHLRIQVARAQGDRSANWVAYKTSMIEEYGPDIVGELHSPRSERPVVSSII